MEQSSSLRALRFWVVRAASAVVGVALVAILAATPVRAHGLPLPTPPSAHTTPPRLLGTTVSNTLGSVLNDATNAARQFVGTTTNNLTGPVDGITQTLGVAPLPTLPNGQALSPVTVPTPPPTSIPSLPGGALPTAPSLAQLSGPPGPHQPLTPTPARQAAPAPTAANTSGAAPANARSAPPPSSDRDVVAAAPPPATFFDVIGRNAPWWVSSLLIGTMLVTAAAGLHVLRRRGIQS